ncbi:unnamed protein product [Prunus armeniaca]|uniref:Uncharacterized protein n=1 Tax=Prunus armeniaca TaxID=36596 RepID=A0A6J5VQ23_PRUAR|nr:unnamed protein product [Prunus armeniaca]
MAQLVSSLASAAVLLGLLVVGQVIFGGFDGLVDGLAVGGRKLPSIAIEAIAIEHLGLVGAGASGLGAFLGRFLLGVLGQDRRNIGGGFHGPGYQVSQDCGQRRTHSGVTGVKRPYGSHENRVGGPLELAV